jgi:His-Xaa-Ser system protein HxsD
MRIEIAENVLSVFVDRNIYSSDVLHKCFYWYTAGFIVEIESHSESAFLVRLQAKTAIADALALMEKIKQDLIDFKLRDIVTKETQTIRELLVAKAFAYDEEDSDPISEVSDPVGFNPNHHA